MSLFAADPSCWLQHTVAVVMKIGICINRNIENALTEYSVGGILLTIIHLGQTTSGLAKTKHHAWTEAILNQPTFLAVSSANGSAWLFSWDNPGDLLSWNSRRLFAGISETLIKSKWLISFRDDLDFLDTNRIRCIWSTKRLRQLEHSMLIGSIAYSYITSIILRMKIGKSFAWI